MKNSITITLFSILLLASAFTTYTSLKWNIGEGFEIKFTSDEPSGIFSSLKGDVVFDENDLEGSSFNMTVDVNSINTGKGMQNKHAVSDKWFDAEKYPTITFKSTELSKADGNYSVSGDLTIKDVTKKISFPFTFENNTFNGTFDVDRLVYQIGDMEGMSKNASQILKVDISVPVTK